MTKATELGGALNYLQNCYISIPSLNQKIFMQSVPDISDSKSANYPDETALGRSMPFKMYHSSEIRAISWTAHFIATNSTQSLSNSNNVVTTDDIINNLEILQACLYPMDGDGTVPYYPPPICKLRCGSLLSSDGSDIPCILKGCNVKFDSSMPWDDESYIPYKLDIDLQFEVVYNQSSLPGASQIMASGY